MKEETNNAGLLPKYNISKATGEPVSPEAEYFVLRLDSNDDDPIHVWACRKALVAYASELYDNDHLSQLADDIMNCWGYETVARWLMTELANNYSKINDESIISQFMPRLTEALKTFHTESHRCITESFVRDMLIWVRFNNSPWWRDYSCASFIRFILREYLDLIK